MNPTQRARTVQAWSRTCSATIVLVLVGVRLAFDRGVGPGVVAVVALVAAAAIAELGHRRAGLIVGTAPPPALHGGTALALVGTVLFADVLGIVLLFG